MCGKDTVPTIRMEVVADVDLYIWHLFFSLPGILSDTYILSLSPHLTNTMHVQFPPGQPKTMEGEVEIDWACHLTDGIYPSL